MQEKTYGFKEFKLGMTGTYVFAKGKNQIKRKKMKMQTREKIH